ncbi:MAG: DUF2924 domain-containing protein [Sphingomonas sp.]|nr:DUF2924 domain-containing protein [Sphingomonas sp.]
MSVPIKQRIDELARLPLEDLRSEWQRWHPDKSLPNRLPRDLLLRTIAWKMQEKQFGHVSSALIARLDKLSGQLSGSGSLDLEREIRLKTGTSIIREWHGQTYRVTALDEGFMWNEQRFESLSEIARAITGVRWSGPRFFGLKQRRRSGQNSASELARD